MNNFRDHINWRAGKVTNLFKEPVTRVFCWVEFGFAGGELFVVYELNGIYCYLSSGCGSCSGCDTLLAAGEREDYKTLEIELERELGKFTIVGSLECVNDLLYGVNVYTDFESYLDDENSDSSYFHPDLVKKWTEFYKRN